MSKQKLANDFVEACRSVRRAVTALIEADPKESTLEMICSDIEQLNEDACEEWELVTGKEPSF